MPNAANGLLQLGLLGAGPTWRRLRAALAPRAELYRVVLVGDEHRRRADDVAAELRCPVAPSIGKLVQHPEVDALLLADPQWHGLWAMEEAIRLGKPVLSAVPLAAEPDQVERLLPLIESAERTVHFIEPWHAPALAQRLHELLASELGPARHLAAELRGPSEPLPATGLARLLHLLCFLLAKPPTQATRLPLNSQAVALVGQWADGVSLIAQQVAGPKVTLRLRILCDRGEIEAQLPRRLQWRRDRSRHQELLPATTTLEVELQRFHDLVWAGQRDEGNWEEAKAIARLFQTTSAAADRPAI